MAGIRRRTYQLRGSLLYPFAGVVCDPHGLVSPCSQNEQLGCWNNNCSLHAVLLQNSFPCTLTEVMARHPLLHQTPLGTSAIAQFW
jgi:hypothetical protein